MKIVTRKLQPKFTRKPNHSVQKQSIAAGQETPSLGSSMKKLQISNNVFNLIVVGCSEDKQVELSRLLFTNQKPCDWKSSRYATESIQNSELSNKKFFEYSPDSVAGNTNNHFNLNDSEILIDGYQKRLQKQEISTIPATNFTFQKSEECLQHDAYSTKVSAFELAQAQDKKIPASSISVSFIAYNPNIFMLKYSFKSQARTTLTEQAGLFKGDSERLINRLRVFFKRYPLMMFAFYHDVLAEYQNLQLREFLLKNSIRYSTDEISCLQRHINQALDMCKGEDLLEFMFMTAEDGDMTIVNLSDTEAQNQISLSQTNLWKALTPLLHVISHQQGAAAFQIRKIEEFIAKLL